MRSKFTGKVEGTHQTFSMLIVSPWSISNSSTWEGRGRVGSANFINYQFLSLVSSGVYPG
jgi:hypothetical protein